LNKRRSAELNGKHYVEHQHRDIAALMNGYVRLIVLYGNEHGIDRGE
jgi:hypothetical protein